MRRTRRSSTAWLSDGVPRSGRLPPDRGGGHWDRAVVLAKAARLELAESALAAPQASFGEVEFYPEFVTKAAVLCARLAWNHPLPDGNKRAAWVALREFCARNRYRLRPTSIDDAVSTMEALAAHQIDEAQLASWIEARIVPAP